MTLFVPEAPTANVPDLIEFLLPIYQRLKPTHQICACCAQQLRLIIAFVMGPSGFWGRASLRGCLFSRCESVSRKPAAPDFVLAYFLTSKVTLDSVLYWQMCHETQIHLICIYLLICFCNQELKDSKTFSPQTSSRKAGLKHVCAF